VDWEIRPVHPVRVVPYALAALWDARQEEQQRRAARRSSAIKEAMVKKEMETLLAAGRVPRSLRTKLKRSHGAKSLAQELEEEIRKFVQAWKDKEEKRHRRDSTVGDEDEDDFVVVRPESSHSVDSDGYVDLGRHPEREKLVFHGLEGDQFATFG
jgi:hypothetical protein